MEQTITFGLLTVSDRCYRNETIDSSGSKMEQLIKSNRVVKNGVVKERVCVPDESTLIQNVLLKWCDEDGLDVILTMGGTGFGVRDVTPEATRKVLERPAPAMATAITNASLKVTPFAMLSRGICGIRKKSLIVNLPGSEKGSGECFEVVAPTLSHAVALLKDAGGSVDATHRKVQNQVSPFTVTSKVDVGRVADRPRESVWPMLSVEESQRLVVDNLKPPGSGSSADFVPEEEIINLWDCVNRVVAHDVVATSALPPFPASIKDGYAVLSADTTDLRKLVGSSVAGAEYPDSFVLRCGECVRVNTGSPIPNGADAVVQVEDTELIEKDSETGEEKSVRIIKNPNAGQDIRPVGHDIAIGETVLKKGELLGAAELGLLATLGITQVPVYKLPTVSVLSTGNELVEPSEELKPGTIRDSNKTTLMSLLKEHGQYPSYDLGISVDNPSDLLAKLIRGMDKSDVIVTTGSVSMGDRDYLKRVLVTDLNATVHFGRIDMKPGKPTTFATCKGLDGRHKLVFCLPGNPVSAMVTFHLYVLPALRILSGHPQPFPTTIKIKLTEEVKLDTRPEYKRAMIDWNSEDKMLPLARITGNQISSRLASCHRANCLLVLPSSAMSTTDGILPPFSVVDAHIISSLV